jgi:hypothetical protein
LSLRVGSARPNSFLARLEIMGSLGTRRRVGLDE